MKNRFVIYIITIAIFIASCSVLAGCMFAIATENGEMKVYDMVSRIDGDIKEYSIESRIDDDIKEYDIESRIDKEEEMYNIGIQSNEEIRITFTDNNPQTELQKKFSAMYDISDDKKIVTVISEEFLNDYWQDNYEKEVIHSLTTEEVNFIIQDSIRIYMEHDKVVLAGFASVSSNMSVAERFPYLEDQEVCRPVTSYLDRDKIEADIHTIIMYRLKALTSPKAFFTGAEAIRFAGGDPVAYNSMYPESVFYIPGYSTNTDRDYILSVMGGVANFTDLERFMDLFEISVEGSINIRFGSVANGSITEVYPAKDLLLYAFDMPEESKDSNDNNSNVETPEIFKPHFILDVANKRFNLTMTPEASSSICGFYVEKDDKLIFYPYDGNASEELVYVFQYQEGNGYNYIKGESNPVPGYEFEDDAVFSLNDDILQPIE